MSNLRVVYKNKVEDADSIVASSTNGTLSISNVLTEKKSQVHRSSGDNVTYTITWGSDQSVRCVILPCINLHSTATVTVELYASGDVLLTSQTANVLVNYEQGIQIDVNTFSLGMFSKVSKWYEAVIAGVRKCVITITDTNNLVGYIDCSKIIIGEYWTPLYNFENGVELFIEDSSRVSTNNSGDTVVDRGFISDAISFKFSLLSEIDRNNLNNILRLVGSNKNVLISLFPNDIDNEPYYLIYGIIDNTSITHRVFGFYNSSIKVTSW